MFDQDLRSTFLKNLSGEYFLERNPELRVEDGVQDGVDQGIGIRQPLDCKVNPYWIFAQLKK